MHELGGKTQPEVATWYAVPAERVVRVEHPCIIKDIDNGIKSLGGELNVNKLLQTDDKAPSIGVSLRPNDPLARPVMSRMLETEDLLLRITVPRRTGRKRKRGSSGPFVVTTNDLEAFMEDGPLPRSGVHLRQQDLLQDLRNSLGSYTVRPVGVIEKTHRFRNLPDFQFSTTTSPIMSEIRNGFAPMKYEKVKASKLNVDKVVIQNTDLASPASFTRLTVPHNYSYRQNPMVRVAVDGSGQVTAFNTQVPVKRGLFAVKCDVEVVPVSPPGYLEPEDKVEPHLKDVVRELRVLLDKRPIVTRRVMLNNISRKYEYLYKLATNYVGYTFRSGPWKDALIKYGVDPRSDPKYRYYQTMTFQVNPKDKRRSDMWSDGKTKWEKGTADVSRRVGSHLFDGTTIVVDGKTWQACDITDPLLREILETDKLRSECDNQMFGWFQNGTWSKARVIMREKISILMAGGIPSDEIYRRFVTLPEIIDDATVQEYHVGRTAGSKVIEIATDIRNLAKSNEQLNLRLSRQVGSSNTSRPLSEDGRLKERSTASAVDENGLQNDHLDVVMEGEQEGDFDASDDDVETEAPEGWVKDRSGGTVDGDAEREQEKEVEGGDQGDDESWE
ncbi:RNA polymerase III transcription factor IIIC subunit-domain-containing protein [Cryomyces antarcticus]